VGPLGLLEALLPPRNPQTGAPTWCARPSGVHLLYGKSHGTDPQVVGDGEKDLTVLTSQTA